MTMPGQTLQRWYRGGDPFVWLSAAAVTLSLMMVVGLLLLIGARGLGYFWPQQVWQLDYQWQGQQQSLLGQIQSRSQVSLQQLQDAGIALESTGPQVERWLFKVGNRELDGVDFRSLLQPLVTHREAPPDAVVVRRIQFGDFYGYLTGLVLPAGQTLAAGPAWQQLPQQLDMVEALRQQARQIEQQQMGRINHQLEALRLESHRLQDTDQDQHRRQQLTQQRAQLQTQFAELQQRLAGLYQQLEQPQLLMVTASGDAVQLPLSRVLSVYRPNAMSLLDKVRFYGRSVWRFVSTDPRESNTEGGVFPAIFGTVMMVLLMSVVVMPLGVITAVYLREYARDGWLVRLVRIGVNNLAGVPSIVYGVFGLGFFVYFVGQHLDQWLYSESLPTPTFGTPGILWASLTLALLTLPVVIVSTEEGLARIPASIREGSLALGATRSETLWRTVLPMASPAIMTGLILAIARAAGEVAPLMLVGVVKFAPSLPVDGNAPYLHLERQFMHLGYHIYEVGFQGPNTEASQPLVYATALLLVLVIVALNLSAIIIRNRLRRRYRTLQ